MIFSNYVNRALRHMATGMVGRVTDQRLGFNGYLLDIQLGNGGRDTLSLRQLEANYEWLDGLTVSPMATAEIIPFPAKRTRVIPIRIGPFNGGAA